MGAWIQRCQSVVEWTTIFLMNSKCKRFQCNFDGNAIHVLDIKHSEALTHSVSEILLSATHPHSTMINMIGSLYLHSSSKSNSTDSVNTSTIIEDIMYLFNTNEVAKLQSD